MDTDARDDYLCAVEAFAQNALRAPAATPRPPRPVWHRGAPDPLTSGAALRSAVAARIARLCDWQRALPGGPWRGAPESFVRRCIVLGTGYELLENWVVLVALTSASPALRAHVSASLPRHADGTVHALEAMGRAAAVDKE